MINITEMIRRDQILQKPRRTGHYFPDFVVEAAKMEDAWNFLANFQDFVCC